MVHKPTLHDIALDIALWAALPMAHTTRIEGRLQMILEAGRPRRVLTRTRRALLVSLTAAALGCGTLAALQPGTRARAVDTQTPWKQTLPNGATIEVLGVSNAPTREKGGWWRPDGTPLVGSPFGPPMDNPVTGRDRRAFALRVTSPQNGPTKWQSVFSTYEAPGAASVRESNPAYLSSVYVPRMPGLEVVSAGADALPAPGTLRCGLATGAWEMVKTARISVLPAGGGFTFHGVPGSVLFSRPKDVRGSAVMTVSDTFSKKQGLFQVVAVDISGKTVTGDYYSEVETGAMRQTVIRFRGMPLSRVKEVRFQALPYQWTEFRGIALKPGAGEARR